MTPKDIKALLNQYITNCESLIEKGVLPSAICVEGQAGISKTSIMKQIAAEKHYKIHVIQMSQIDDLGHLVGFPQKEYAANVSDNGVTKKVWFPEGTHTGKNLTGETRMGYALPAWLKGLKPDDKFILLLDDFTRSTPMVMQAVMQLIDEYKYGSWKLPKNSLIFLTSNPDNGDYAVTSLDFAQKTRFMVVPMEFCPESWAEWAETVYLDSRCINFVLYHKELFEENDTKEKTFNARSMTKFFQNIGQLDSFENNLTYIQSIGKGSVGDVMTSMFVTFIHNKLDRIPSPEFLLDLSNKESEIMQKLFNCCGSYKGDYKAPLASVIATRLVNYILLLNGSWVKENNNRLISLILSDSFSQDLKLFMAKKLAESNNIKIKMILSHPEILKLLV